MKQLTLILFLMLSLAANDRTHTFAKNSACKVCHPTIYKEFSSSQHLKSTIYKDPIHKAIWDKHPKNRKKHQYGCAKCHTPAANNLNEMIAKTKNPAQNAMPNRDNETHNEAISCAYCHRIQSITLGKQRNTNVISLEERLFFGTRGKHINSPYHGIDTTHNQAMQNGNVCAGCHSHKKNNHNLNVCSTNIAKEINEANCVSCHMPKVKGSVSTVRKTKTHTFHGFPGTHQNNAMLQDFIVLQAVQTQNGFSVEVQNLASHALLLHPLRVGQLQVKHSRKGKVTPLATHNFVRILGKNKKPAMPWMADKIIKNTMLQKHEKRFFDYTMVLQKGDIIEMTLGYYLVNPKAAHKLGLDQQNFHTFKVLKTAKLIVE